MTDDHSAARDVIAGQLDVYPDPDCIIAALTDAGWQITRRDPAAGRVCVDLEDASAISHALSAAMSLDHYGRFAQRFEYAKRQIVAALNTEATTG